MTGRADGLLVKPAHNPEIFSNLAALSDRELAFWLANYGSALARFRLCDDVFHTGDKQLFWRMAQITQRLNSGALPGDIFPSAAR